MRFARERLRVSRELPAQIVASRLFTSSVSLLLVVAQPVNKAPTMNANNAVLLTANIARSRPMGLLARNQEFNGSALNRFLLSGLAALRCGVLDESLSCAR
ncbi:MAG TPA: hypothetical protein VHK24_04840 [Steroidobacter sp.]|nr:hypothetical protein [Steroidobacter sp.]